MWRCVVLLATTTSCGRFDFDTHADAPPAVKYDAPGDAIRACPVSFAGDMAAYWPLDESPGATTFADQSGHGHDLTCTPCPTAGIAGVRGSAVSLQNAGNGYNDASGTPSVGSLATLTQLTLAAWVNLQQVASQGWILSNDRDCTGCGGPYRGYGLLASSGTASEFHVWDGGVDARYPAGGPMPPVGEWHFLAGTYDGTMVRFYYDGALSEERSAGGFQNPPSFDTQLGGMGANPDNGMTGFLDEVIVLDRAATVDEVQDLMRGCR